MNNNFCLKMLVFVACCWFAFSCNENEDFQPKRYTVSGKVEKGPFVSGSTVTMQPMDAKLQVSGETYSAVILDDIGNFAFGSTLLNAPYAELTATGYFFNEVSGALSSGMLNLRALVDLSDESTINVNILTHLKYPRIIKLIASGKNFEEANRQAQEELFASFGLSEYSQEDAASFSIVSGNDQSAVLIAVSSLLLVDRSEASVTEYLAKLCREFGENGTFSEQTKVQIKEDRKKLSGRLDDIRSNIVERYAELGMSVEVKDLARFFDWDDSGKVGDEILQEGEKIIIETTRIEIPNTGGSYQVKIISPIPVYLEPVVDSDEGSVSIDLDQLFENLYEGEENQHMSVEKLIKDNVLTIDVAPLNCRVGKTMTVYLYDCLGNELGTIELVQAGNSNASIPLLGSEAEVFVNGMAEELSSAFSEYSVLEQYYHYNKDIGLVNQYVYPECSPIFDSWSAFYRFNRMNLLLKDTDEKRLGVWQDIFDVFDAMQYYYTVVAWGGVPRITEYDWYQGGNWTIPRNDADSILYDLQENLEQAVETLDNKKNESLKDANGFFFLSKDVADFLLANICMYQHDYGKAAAFLRNIMDNGFYELDGSNYSMKETIDRILAEKSGKELLFAFYVNNGSRGIRSRSVITIQYPPLIPLMTYTDVVLSYAECLYKQGDMAGAKEQLMRVVEAKNITVGDDVWNGIVDARKQLLLYCNSNFAFMKRNGLAIAEYGVEDYRLLWPIPQSELFNNPAMKQNPGY